MKKFSPGPAFVLAILVSLSTLPCRAQQSSVKIESSTGTAVSVNQTAMNDSAGAVILADSSVRAADSTQIDHNTVTRIGNIAIPGWLQSAIACLLVLLPAIQYTLKRIPTPYSVKICGVLGKILDFFTSFQKDKNDLGGSHGSLPKK